MSAIPVSYCGTEMWFSTNAAEYNIHLHCQICHALTDRVYIPFMAEARLRYWSCGRECDAVIRMTHLLEGRPTHGETR